MSAEKKGKLDFRVEKAGIVHATIGRKSMGADKFARENYLTFMAALIRQASDEQRDLPSRDHCFGHHGSGVPVDVNKHPGRVVDRMWN